MDVKQLAQTTLDMFNDRSFRTKSKDMVDPGVVVTDSPTGQEMRGVDGFVQYSDGFVVAMPDIKGTAIEHTVNGNKVTTRVRGQGTFTGTLTTPQGAVPGTGKSVDLEYKLEQEFNDAGKLMRFTVNYDMPEFMRQLGVG
ncbi:MAG TPA: ester cyclase [Candidatus Binatia bacterium]|nr:ester cyclase [Candidatus Binatia bacterium]